MRLVYCKPDPKQIAFKVTDAGTGKPLQALVCIEMVYSFCWQGGPIGETDANGLYRSDTFCTDHLGKFGVQKEGYEPKMFAADEFVPGKRYEVALRRVSDTEEVAAKQ